MNRILIVPCLICGFADQELRRIHDLGDTRLVVGAEQRGAVGGDDVVADLVGERRVVRETDDLRGVGRQRDVAAPVIPDDLGPDVLPVQSGEVSICEQKQMTGTRLSLLAGIVA